MKVDCLWNDTGEKDAETCYKEIYLKHGRGHIICESCRDCWPENRTIDRAYMRDIKAQASWLWQKLNTEFVPPDEVVKEMVLAAQTLADRLLDYAVTRGVIKAK